MFMYGGFRFLYYLSENTKFNLVTYLTTTKIFLCTQLTVFQTIQTLSVTQYTLVFLLCFGSSTITKTFFY